MQDSVAGRGLIALSLGKLISENGGPLMKWEYKYISIGLHLSDKKTANLINEELGKLGDDGWELVNFVNIVVDARYALIFKRPKE